MLNNYKMLDTIKLRICSISFIQKNNTNTYHLLLLLLAILNNLNR